MKQTVTENDFIQAFEAIRPDNFSLEGLRALFDWFEDYESGTGEEMELDVIAICCDFTEYSSALECTKDMVSEDFDNEDEALEYLQDHTIVIHHDSGIIIQSF